MRKIEFSLGEYYHIYNRGTEKRLIFLEKKDYRRFMSLLFLCNDTKPITLHKNRDWNLDYQFEENSNQTIVDIGAYCLMPNHFHILMREKTKGGISKFMHKIGVAYTMYFNTKYSRTGSLYENTFKAKHANDDEYLKYLYSYIHLNPVKIIDPKWKEDGIQNTSKAKEFLNSYQYSSYPEYCEIHRNENIIINKQPFPEYFSKKTDFLTTLNDFLTYQDET